MCHSNVGNVGMSLRRTQVVELSASEGSKAWEESLRVVCRDWGFIRLAEWRFASEWWAIDCWCSVFCLPALLFCSPLVPSLEIEGTSTRLGRARPFLPYDLVTLKCAGGCDSAESSRNHLLGARSPTSEDCQRAQKGKMFSLNTVWGRHSVRQHHSNEDIFDNEDRASKILCILYIQWYSGTDSTMYTLRNACSLVGHCPNTHFQRGALFRMHVQ